MDIFPTVANVSGTGPSRQQVDGVDIWPLLSGQKAELDREPHLYFDNIHLQCIRAGKWKLHVARYNSSAYNPVPRGGRVNLPLRSPELYNLIADPDESYDVAPENPKVVADIRDRAESLLAGFPDEIRNAYAATKAITTAPSAVGHVPRQ